MAKIAQLGTTYNRAPLAVNRTPIRTDGLTQGLDNASQAYLTAQKIKDNARAQRDVYEQNVATLEAKDFLNKYLTSMDSPDKFKENFGGTAFEDYSGIMAGNIGVYDSTTAQTHYKYALDQIGMGSITDEQTREAWKTEMLIKWEDVEPKYQDIANGFIHQEAVQKSKANLQAIWNDSVKEGTGGTESLVFRTALDNMLGSGMYGTDPQQAIIAMNNDLLAYQKTESRFFLDEVYREALMPLQMKGASKEEMTIALYGANLEGMGKNYLTDEEMEKHQEKWVSRAMNYSNVIQNVIEEESARWYSNQWEDIFRIERSSGADGKNPFDMAQAKIDQIIGMMGEDLPSVQTDIEGAEPIPLGQFDRVEGKKMKDYLEAFMSGDELDSERAAEGTIQMANIVGNYIGMTVGEQDAALSNLLRDRMITNSQYTSARNQVRSFSNDQEYKDSISKAMKIAEAEGFTEAQRAGLATELQNYFVGARNLNNIERAMGAESIINNYADKEGRMTDMADDFAKGALDMAALSIRNRGENVRTIVSRDTGAIQKSIDNGDFRGNVEMNAELLSAYTTKMGLSFQAGMAQGAWPELDRRNLVVNDRNEPVVVAQVVDKNGVPWIAALAEDQSDLPANAIAVRVFSSKLREGSNRQLKFEEQTEYERYYVSGYNADGSNVVFTDGEGALIDLTSDMRINIIADSDYYVVDQYGQKSYQQIELSTDVENIYRNREKQLGGVINPARSRNQQPAQPAAPTPPVQTTQPEKEEVIPTELYDRYSSTPGVPGFQGGTSDEQTANNYYDTSQWLP